MNDFEGKKWTLLQIKRKYSKGKGGKIKGFTLSELVLHVSRERRKIAKKHGIPVGKGKLLGTSNIPEMPPGEDKVRRYARELERDGEIRREVASIYKKPSKKPKKLKKTKKKNKNDHGGGRGKKLILVPTDLSEKIKNLGDTTAIKILRLGDWLERFKEKDNDKIGNRELAEYVTAKNTLFRIPVELAHVRKSAGTDMIFEYVYKDVASICEDVEEKIRKDKRLRPALSALEKLASSGEFLRKAALKIQPLLDNDDLAIAKYVNDIHDLEKPQDSAESTKPLGVTFTEHTKLT